MHYGVLLLSLFVSIVAKEAERSHPVRKAWLVRGFCCFKHYSRYSVSLCVYSLVGLLVWRTSRVKAALFLSPVRLAYVRNDRLSHHPMHRIGSRIPAGSLLSIHPSIHRSVKSPQPFRYLSRLCLLHLITCYLSLGTLFLFMFESDESHALMQLGPCIVWVGEFIKLS